MNQPYLHINNPTQSSSGYSLVNHTYHQQRLVDAITRGRTIEKLPDGQNY